MQRDRGGSHAHFPSPSHSRLAFYPRMRRNEHDVEHVGALWRGVAVLRRLRPRALFIVDPLLTADVGQLFRDYDVALALIFGWQPFEMPHPAPDAT